MKGRAARQAGVGGATVAGTSAALGATAASACCVPVVSPLIVGLLGAGGAAWAASLKPYSPYLLGGSLLLLAYGFWSVYRRPAGCAIGEAASPASRSRRWLRAILWGAAFLWVAALGANLALRSV